MKKQSKKDTTARRQKKITRRSNNREQMEKHMIELSHIVGGLHVATESLLQVLVNKGVITIEEFHAAIENFGKDIKSAEDKVDEIAEAVGSDETEEQIEFEKDGA